MNILKDYFLTSLMFISGLIGLYSGEYIISSALFAASTYTASMLSSRYSA
jgi:hypothetical protein